MSLMEIPDPQGRITPRTRVVQVLDVEMEVGEAIAFLDILEHYARCDGHDPRPVMMLDRLRYELREAIGL